MSWEEKLLKQAKKIIKLYPQKRISFGATFAFSSKQRWLHF